jgi:coenzyme PQQ synthesis protein D (PqqD)
MTSALFRRAANQIACDMGGEVVILDLTSGTYYGLDQLGAQVWSLIEQPASLEAIRNAIVADYDVDAATCHRDVLAFLQQMQAVGLVEVNDGSPV